MPITKVGSTVTKSPPNFFDEYLQTGVIRQDSFAIRDNLDELKQMQFDISAVATNTTVTLKASSSNTGTLNLPAVASGTLMDVTQGSPPVTYNAPANGATVTLTANTTNAATVVLEPAGTIAGATLLLPTAPADGYLVRFSTTATITTLTMTAGGSDTIVNAISTLAANAFAAYVYRASTTKWYRIG